MLNDAYDDDDNDESAYDQDYVRGYSDDREAGLTNAHLANIETETLLPVVRSSIDCN